jgi:hypothetical protein
LSNINSVQGYGEEVLEGLMEIFRDTTQPGNFRTIAILLAASAASAEEPTAPVAKAYEVDGGAFDVTKGLMPWESPSREALFSSRLAALFARDELYGHEAHSVGLLDFDPLLNRQCCGIQALKLKCRLARRGEGGRRGDIRSGWRAENPVRDRL